MRSLERWKLRLRQLGKGRRLEGDLNDELQFHLEQQIAQNEEAGMPPQEARRRALADFGGVEQIKVQCRETRGWLFWEQAWQDISYAARTLRRSPGFAFVALLTLSLGIGATSAIFSVIDAVLLRPLPYPESSRLAVVLRDQGEGAYSSHSGPAIRFLLDNLRSLEEVYSTGGGASGVNLVVNGRAEYVQSMSVTSGFFRTLGLPPSPGRGFEPGEDRSGGAASVVLSHALWTRLFNADSGAVGSKVLLGGEPYTVVGISSPEFRTFPPADIWVPLHIDRMGDGTNYQLIGRLAPGVTFEQAGAELSSIVESLRQVAPRELREQDTMVLSSYRRNLTEDARPSLLVLLAAAAMLLLIASSNTACLLLARGSGRSREIAIRGSLGGGRLRIVRQMLAESVLLAAFGGLLGLVVARAGIGFLLALSPASYQIWDARIDYRVLGATMAVSLLTGLLFGLIPAFQASRIDISKSLRQDDARSAGDSSPWPRRLLVAGEAALCVVLLVGAALFIQSLANLLSVDLGFDPRRIMTAQMSLRGTQYQEAQRLKVLFERGLEEIRRLPQVEGAAVCNNLPVERGLNLPIRHPADPERGAVAVDWRYVSPGYFELLSIPLRQGRLLSESDRANTQPAAVINQAFADRYFAQGQVLGQQLQLAMPAPFASLDLRIVGVVGNVKSRGLAGPPQATLYMPMSQVPDRYFQVAHSFFQANWLIKSRQGAAAPIGPMREILRSIDPLQPFSGFRSMQQVIGGSVALPRFQMTLLTVFATLALVMAATGIYGLVSYTVAARGREFGIRIALGATTGRTFRTVLQQGVLLTSLGAAAGLLAALAFSRLLEGHLFQLESTDALTYIGAALLLVSTSALASLSPAIRASHLSPVESLRGD